MFSKKKCHCCCDCCQHEIKPEDSVIEVILSKPKVLQVLVNGHPDNELWDKARVRTSDSVRNRIEVYWDRDTEKRKIDPIPWYNRKVGYR